MTVNTTLRVGGAMLVGIALIGGSLVLSKQQTAAEYTAAVIVTDKPRAYQETHDNDADGLRDWEEELRGTDPTIPNNDLKKVDTPPSEPAIELPKTMTDQFSKDFFAYYLKHNAGDASMTQEQKDAFLKQATVAAQNEVADTLFDKKILNITFQDSPEDWHTYGNMVAKIIRSYPVKDENEMLILDRALKESDPLILDDLKPIIESYKNTITDLKKMAVPKTFTNEHLNLLNSMLAVHNTIVAMQTAFTDPLPTLMRAQSYQTQAESLMKALQSMSVLFQERNILFLSDEPGDFFNAYAL